MSKLIVEMEMPEKCEFCPCAHWNMLNELTGCDAVDGKRYVSSEDEFWRVARPSWCPIKGELLDKHGDLIDRDEVKNEIMKRMPQWCSTASPDDFQFCSRREMLYPISHAKVIVTAERKDDGK